MLTILETVDNNFSLEKTTPYMLRNDGELLPCGDVHPYIKVYYSESYDMNISELLKHPHWLDWYTANSKNNKIPSLIKELRTNPTEQLFNQINDILNNEFCKVRTTNIKYKYGADNGEIYFRLCSQNPDWFNVIWNTVSNFIKDIKYVTVVWDYQTFGRQFDYCQCKGITINKLPVFDFLSIEGNPKFVRQKSFLPEE